MSEKFAPDRVIWKLRDHSFHGAGTYDIALGDQKLSLEVDQNGCFEVDGIIDIPLYPFAALHKVVSGGLIH